MGDQFEKFIMENRSAFDDAEPSEKIWNSIDQKLEKKTVPMNIIWKVAAVLFLVSTVVLLIDRKAPTIEMGPMLSQEFVEAEDYYVTMINQRKELIREQLSPEEEKAFLTEINDLDAMYLELKETYQSNASSERVMDAMINNLQLRLAILNRQLEILEKIKGQNHENEHIIEI